MLDPGVNQGSYYRKKLFKLPLKYWIYGGWQCFLFGWNIRFNFNNEYLRWRLETVFGDPKFRFCWYYYYRMLKWGYWAHELKQHAKL